MQPLRYNRLLHEIHDKLNLSQLIAILDEIHPGPSDMPFTPEIKTRIISFLNKSIIELDRLKSDSETLEVMNAWDFEDFYTLDTINSLLSIIHLYPSNQPLRGGDAWAKYLKFRTALEIFIRAISANDRILHLANLLQEEDSELVTFQIVNFDGTKLNTDVFSTILATISKLSKDTQTLFGLTYEEPSISYVESGSNIAIKVKTGAVIGTFLLGITNFVCDRIEYTASEVADRPDKALTILAVNREIQLQVKEKLIEPAKGEALKNKVIDDLTKLYELNVLVDNGKRKTIEFDRLLSYKVIHTLKEGPNKTEEKKAGDN